MPKPIITLSEFFNIHPNMKVEITIILCHLTKNQAMGLNKTSTALKGVFVASPKKNSSITII
jgi:hypothetical protein